MPVLVLLLLLASACAFPAPTADAPKAFSNPPGTVLAGQLFIVTLRHDAQGNDLHRLDPASRAFLTAMQPGGVILYGQNIRDRAQLKALITDIRSAVLVPPFIAIDEEGGRVSRLARLADHSRTPSARMLAARGPQAVAEAWEALARELAELGFSMNFAPVADLDFFPDLEYLGDRSFSADPAITGRHVVTAVQALQRHGVVAVVKHFPGHGRAGADSHVGLPLVSASRSQLEADLLPFRQAFGAGAAAVMTAHVRYPALDQTGLPASFSMAIIGGLLRGELGFAGLVATDALEMQGAALPGGEAQAAELALTAGAELILGASNPIAARNALLARSELGPALRAAWNKIIRQKITFHLFDLPALPRSLSPR